MGDFRPRVRIPRTRGRVSRGAVKPKVHPLRPPAVRHPRTTIILSDPSQELRGNHGRTKTLRCHKSNHFPITLGRRGRVYCVGPPNCVGPPKPRRGL